MKIKEILILSILLLFSSIIFSQSNLVFVSFKSRNTSQNPIVETTIRIENNGVEASIHVTSMTINDDGKKKSEVFIDSTYNLKLQNFEKFAQAALGLKSETFLPNINFKGLRGGKQTEIEFGNEYNSITYKVWSPFVETKKRQLDTYINTCKLFIKAGKLNVKDLL